MFTIVFFIATSKSNAERKTPKFCLEYKILYEQLEM